MRSYAAWICLGLALAGPFVVVARIALGAAMAISDAGKDIFESGEDEAAEEFDGQDMLAVLSPQDAGVDAISMQAPSTDQALLHTLPPCLETDCLAASLLRAGPWRWPPPGGSARQSLLQSFRF